MLWGGEIVGAGEGWEGRDAGDFLLVDAVLDVEGGEEEGEGAEAERDDQAGSQVGREGGRTVVPLEIDAQKEAGNWGRRGERERSFRCVSSHEWGDATLSTPPFILPFLFSLPPS